jgi:hypothetical protein
LAEGKARLKWLIGTKYLGRLDAGDWHAISFGLRYICGWREGDLNVGIEVQPRESDVSIQVEFVAPKTNGQAEYD